MNYETWGKFFSKTEIKTTQLQGLVNDLTEPEQEMISGFGGYDDGWINGFSLGENQESQKNWIGSNFRVSIGDLPSQI